MCGRFSNDQLNRDIVLATTLKNNSQWKATGLMLSAMLTMSACNEEDRMTTGMIAPVEQIDIQEDAAARVGQIISEEIIESSADYDGFDFVLGMVSSYGALPPPPPPPSKFMFVLAISLLLGGISLFIFVLEMIVRAAA